LEIRVQFALVSFLHQTVRSLHGACDDRADFGLEFIKKLRRVMSSQAI